MFFENEILSLNILDIITLDQTNVSTLNKGRNFNALSFRIHTDARLKAGENEICCTDGSVAYVPARLDYTRNAHIDNLIVIHFDTANYHTDTIEHFLPKDTKTLYGLFSRILSCWNKKETGYKYKATALLYEIFGECYIQNFIPSDKNSKIQSSVDYMTEHYRSKSLSMSEIANRSFVSEVYFRKLFKKEYGISPKKYIIQLRLQYATGMISTGYFSLKEISDMSGYNDYKHFSTEFKKELGISPSEYLYNYRQNGTK